MSTMIFGKTLSEIMDQPVEVLIKDRSAVSLETTVTHGSQKFFPYRGEGNCLLFRDGRRVLDFSSQYGVAPLGHYFPRTHKRMFELLQEFDEKRYVSSVDPDPGHILEIELKRQLLSFLPDGYEFVLFELSGATANNLALKIAERVSPSRHLFGSFERGFYGRHQPVQDLTASNTTHKSSGYRPTLTPIYFPYPSSSKHAERLRDFIFYNEQRTFSLENMAAFIGELLMQGEGGVYVAQNKPMRAFVKMLQEKGVLVIADECQSFVRTGKRCAFEHLDIKPDIITLSKVFSWYGFQMSAVIVRRGLITKGVLPLGWHSGSQLGQPKPCLAGLVFLETVIKENLVERADKMGCLLKKELQRVLKNNPFIKEIRGRGLMVGIDIVNPKGKKPDAALLKLIVGACHEKGLEVGTAGNSKHETVIRLLPSLLSTEEEIHFAVRQIQYVFDLYYSEARG